MKELQAEFQIVHEEYERIESTSLVQFHLFRILQISRKNWQNSNKKKNNFLQKSIQWNLNMEANQKWLQCFSPPASLEKNNNKKSEFLKKYNHIEINLRMLRINSWVWNNHWLMPRRIYHQIILLNKCYMESEVKWRKIEKS